MDRLRQNFLRLIARVDKIIVEDGLIISSIIRVFEEFFLSYFPDKCIIPWVEYFEIVVFMHPNVNHRHSPLPSIRQSAPQLFHRVLTHTKDFT